MLEELENRLEELRKKLIIPSWCLFDFGSTAFMMNIVSSAFPQWLSQTFGKESADSNVGIITGICYILCFFLYPLTGKICDKGWKLLPLFILTLLSILGTGLLGCNTPLLVAAVLFIIAYLTYQLGLTFYTALLDDIATPESYGIVSGLGVAIRYLGAMFGLFMTIFFIDGSKQTALPQELQALLVKPLEAGQIDYINAFLPTAILYAICTLPLFLLIRRKKVEIIAQEQENSVSILSVFVDSYKNKNTFWLLVSLFLTGIPVYAAVSFMTIVLTEIGQIPAGEVNNFLVFLIPCAVASGLIFGLFLRRMGNKLAFYITAVLWGIAMSLGTFVSGSLSMWFIGALAGIGMGAYWTVSRILILDVAPKEQQGGYLALLFLMMVVCGVVASLVLWPGVIEITKLLQAHNIIPKFIVQRASMGAIAILTILGIITYRKVSWDK